MRDVCAAAIDAATGAGAERRVACAALVETAVAGEAPRAVHEHSHADPFALEVADVLDAAVLRRHALRPADDRACVRVRRSGTDRGVDRRSADVAHGRTLSAATLTLPQALVAELVDALG